MELKEGDKLQFTALVGDNRVNDFMRAADLRPDYKVYARQYTMIATADGTVTDIAVMFDKMLAAMQKAYIVVSLTFDGRLQMGRLTRFVDLTYVDAQFREISDGSRSYFLGGLPTGVAVEQNS